MADIWTNLNTFKLGDVEASNIQRQTDPIHIEELNRQSLEDTKLINDATMRSSGTPMPGTGSIQESPTVTDDTRTVAYTPAKGEVWQIQSITRNMTGGTGAGPVTLYIYDTITENLMAFFYGSSTSGEFFLEDDGTWGGAFTIDENTQLQFKCHTAANWESCILQLHMCRIR